MSYLVKEHVSIDNIDIFISTDRVINFLSTKVPNMALVVGWERLCNLQGTEL